jgi:hypothetical protein
MASMISSTTPFVTLDIVLVLAGQSNMAGRGPIENQQPYQEFIELNRARINKQIYLYKNKSWNHNPVEPLHSDKPERVGVGPGLSAAVTIAKAFPSLRIGLVPTAHGGSEIDRWHPQNGDLFLDMKNKVEHSLSITNSKTKPACMILWHQGESDCTVDKAPLYENKLSLTIQQFSFLLNRWNKTTTTDISPTQAIVTPRHNYIVIGQLGTFCRQSTKLACVPQVCQAIELVAMNEHVHYVSSDGLADNGKFMFTIFIMLIVFVYNYAVVVVKMSIVFVLLRVLILIRVFLTPA